MEDKDYYRILAEFKLKDKQTAKWTFRLIVFPVLFSLFCYMMTVLFLTLSKHSHHNQAPLYSEVVGWIFFIVGDFIGWGALIAHTFFSKKLDKWVEEQNNIELDAFRRRWDNEWDQSAQIEDLKDEIEELKEEIIELKYEPEQ